jgi:hypothetical protein
MSLSISPPDTESMDPLLPIETEIYILPTGEIVVADLPEELAGLVRSIASGPGTERHEPGEANEGHG